MVKSCHRSALLTVDFRPRVDIIQCGPPLSGLRVVFRVNKPLDDGTFADIIKDFMLSDLLYFSGQRGWKCFNEMPKIFFYPFFCSVGFYTKHSNSLK